MNYTRRQKHPSAEQSDDAQSERQLSPDKRPNGDPSEEDMHSEEREAELDERINEGIAELQEYQMSQPRKIPLQFSPPHAYTQGIDLISRDIAATEKLILQQIQNLTDAALQAEELEMSKEVEKIQDSVKALIDQNNVVQAYRTNFNKFKSALLQAKGDPIKGSLVAALNTAVAAEHTSNQAKSSSSKYSNSPIYREFKLRIWEVNHPDEAMPPLSDDDGSEEDIVVARQVENFKCPLTTTWYKDPVTSQGCKHTFSKDAIMELIRSSHNDGIDCPVTGCNKRVSQRSLKPNNDLMRRLERARALQSKNSHKSKDARENVTVLDS
ncbi:hypothetical protein DSO57_1026502 [Entomophthora muscae]|uniref:Uncharacterized protein n=1 Tax=Entomophthora muscae TaxID=34485 RepID=A0ACC2S3Z7_9FUNG|nr:hypothetical protein DSO57_1026502 [Entomophthora muscae]